jgi:hypothetical protein
MSSGPGYSSTNLPESVSRTEPKMSIHLRQLLSTYGGSYKYGSEIHDSASTPIEILESGRNHMADTMVPYLQRASYDMVMFLSSTVGACRYFLQQNDAIRNGTVKGEIINLKVLGMGNPLTVRGLECLSCRPVFNVRN